MTGKLETLADAHDLDTLRRKHKAIIALFPYVVRQERDKEYPIFDTFLRVVEATQSVRFWGHVRLFTNILSDGPSNVSAKRALILASPYLPWGDHLPWFDDAPSLDDVPSLDGPLQTRRAARWRARRPLMTRAARFGRRATLRTALRAERQVFWRCLAGAWAEAVSTVPKEEAIAPSVVDTLFQFASSGLLPSDFSGDAWSWLTLRPSLPPVCKGRDEGGCPEVMKSVQNLEDIEILKSYLLLIWSEWNCLSEEGRRMMEISIREDFSGMEMNSHCADLIQHLDHVFAQLDRGLEHLQQNKPKLDEGDLRTMKLEYGRLRETLLEVDQEARTSSRVTTLFKLPTHVAAHRDTRSRMFGRRDGSRPGSTLHPTSLKAIPSCENGTKSWVGDICRRIDIPQAESVTNSCDLYRATRFHRPRLSTDL